MGKTWQIKWFDTVSSTNDEAEKWLLGHLEGDFDKLSVVAARCQSAGRGQGDHKWHSVPGENLTFTAVITYSDEPGPGTVKSFATRDQIVISQLTALSVVDYLSTKGVDARIKLPNDIYVGDKKICGLLIKNHVRSGRILGTIVGIGLDINETDFPADLPNPTSLKLLTGETYNVEDELEIFLDCYGKRLELSVSLSDIDKEFTSKLR